MTQESFDAIKPGALVGSVRVQEGAAVVDYGLRKGIIVDRNSDLAHEAARSFVVEDPQLGRTAVELAFEHIDHESGEAVVGIHELQSVSTNLLQQATVHAMHEAGVRLVRVDESVTNISTDVLESAGFASPHNQSSETPLALAA